MCFGATASFTAAGVIGVAGAATLPLVRTPREMPLALFGAAFAAHQLIEGIVWRQLDEAGVTQLRTPAVAMWLVFAWALLPVWVPLAVALVEPDARRRHAMVAIGAAGAVVSLTLGIASFAGAVPARVVGEHLSYVVPHGWAQLAIVPYVLVTLAPSLLSSHVSLRLWGVALLTAMSLTAILQNAGFASVWCYFAALLTIMLTGHFLLLRRAPAAAGSFV